MKKQASLALNNSVKERNEEYASLALNHSLKERNGEISKSRIESFCEGAQSGGLAAGNLGFGRLGGM